MPPERRPPDDPIEWLNRAKSNPARATADINLPGVYLEDLCFDAQQAAEKAIKALLEVPTSIAEAALALPWRRGIPALPRR
jgi:HEPN domain-containing protein